MALKLLIAALAVGAAASPLSATRPEPTDTGAAPSAGPDARYCMRISITGSRVDIVRCWTREEWAEQEVDVDREWAENGVRVIA
jgi:hypothetical protein